MKWAHLPVAGGLYAQHPQLLDEWAVLFQLVNEKQAQEMEEMKMKNNAPRRR